MKRLGSTGRMRFTVIDKVAMVANVHGVAGTLLQSGSAGREYAYVEYTNRAAIPVSCALHFHRDGKMDTTTLSEFDLAPGQTSLGKPPEPNASNIGDGLPPSVAGTLQFRCYAKGSVDESGKACTSHLW